MKPSYDNKTLILASIILLSTIFNTAKATTCSNLETLVCEIEPNLSVAQKEVCVGNTRLGQYFTDKPKSLPTSCSDFRMKKIKTYACNAGLKFSANTSKPEQLQDPSLNYFTFGMTDYNDQVGLDELSFVQKSMNASSQNEYAQASSKSGEHIIEDGSKLQFQLGSEVYGAQYFVDLCILNKNLNPERFDLNVLGKVLFTHSLFTQPSYIQESQVLSKVEIYCQNGNNITTKVLSTESPFFSAEKKYNSIINPGHRCFVRHSFKEQAIDKKRSHKFKKISFQTQLNLAAEDEILLIESPKKYCQIKKSGNKFTCLEKTLISDDEIISTALAGQYFNNETYTGACPNPCKLK
jgi:hypothetical protein